MDWLLLAVSTVLIEGAIRAWTTDDAPASGADR